MTDALIKNPKLIVLKKIIISLLIFVPLYIVYMFLFGYDSFWNHYDIGKDIIFWQNLILKIAYLLVYLSFIILWSLKKLKFVFITLVLVSLVGYICFSLVLNYYNTFTSEKWIDHIESRHLMYKDFQEDYDLVGMSKDEVIILLGKSDEVYVHINKDNSLIYLVQDSSWLFKISVDYLLIEFDDNNRVTNFELVNIRE